MFKLASLFVDIKADQAPLDKALSGVRSGLSSASVAVGTFVGNIATGLARAASSFAGVAFTKTIQSASALNESLSKTGTIFGDSAQAVIGQTEQMADKFGLSKQAMLDSQSVLGLFAKGAGQSAEGAADFSNKMTKLAADAMSFYNVPFEEALQKIQSGLSGESEPLRAFGVFLNEDAVAAEALSLGLSKTGKDLDDGAKVMARASLITKGLASASGDLERTFDGTENQSRRFWGSLDNLAQSIGASLLPAFNSLLAAGNTMVDALARGWRNLPEYFTIARIRIAEGIQNLIAWFQVLPENVGRIAAWIGKNWYELIVDGINASITAFKNFGANLQNLGEAIGQWFADPTAGFNFEWKPLLEGFKATADALPEMVKPAFVSMQAEIDAVGQRIADREQARAQKVVATAQAAATTAQKTTEDAKKKDDFKSELLGSADFAARLRSAILGDKDETAKKQLETQKQIAASTAATAEALARPVLARLG